MNNNELTKAINGVDVKAYKQALGLDNAKGHKKIYAIKDNLVDFQEIFFVANDSLALRNFADAINRNPNTPLAQHPDNFELWKIANMDGLTGKLTEDIRRIAIAKDLLEKSE